MRRRFVRVCARVLEIAGIIAGLAIVGSCTSAGYLSEGALFGLVAFAISFVVAALFVAAIYLLTTMSDDVSELRTRMERGNQPQGGEDQRLGS